MSNDDREAQALADSTAFMRSNGLPPSWGKATEEVKFRVPFRVKQDLAAVAHARGMSESELGRLYLMMGLYGFDEVRRMQDEHLRQVGSSWHKAGVES